MSIAKSFIDHMEVIHNVDKPVIHHAGKLSIDFNFEEKSVGSNSNLYCFFNKNKNSAALIKDSMNNKSKKPTLTNTRSTTSPVHQQLKSPMHTDITTIKLFEQDELFVHRLQKPSSLQKCMSSITTTVSAFFSKLKLKA